MAQISHDIFSRWMANVVRPANPLPEVAKVPIVLAQEKKAIHGITRLKIS